MSTTAPVPICRDCRHYNINRPMWSDCTRKEKIVAISPVYGYPIRKGAQYAEHERESRMPWRCGPGGRYFEAVK